MRIIVEIKPGWVFQGSGERGSTIHQLVRKLIGNGYNAAEIVNEELTRAEIEYSGGESVQSFAVQVRRLLEQTTGESYDGNVFSITVERGDQHFSLRTNDVLEKRESLEDDIFAQINALQGIANQQPTSQVENREEQEPHIEKPAISSASSSEELAQGQVEQRINAIPEEAKDEDTEVDTDVNEPTALEQIHDLVGNASFKELADEVSITADRIIKNKTQGIFFSEAYLFSINTGSGYHTSLSLYSKLLTEVKLFNGVVQSESISIPSFDDKEVSVKMNNAMSVVQNALGKQRLICIDLTEWIGHTNSKELKRLLMLIFRENDKCAVVFRIPYVKQAVLENIVKDLEDIISVRPVVFEPFNDEELREIASRYLARHEFDLSHEAWEVFDKRIVQEKANGYFYGVHTVHKVIGDIIRKKELIGAKQGTEDKHIADEIQDMISSESDNEQLDHLEELHSMIGMQKITNRVIEIINQIVYARSTGLRSKPTMHMCFVGNPGTGKTTVARIIGQVLKERGVLRIGNFYEHHGRDLCGQYVGTTAPKTHAICEEAYGSILFIDEAYSLATDGDRYNYGKEAIDTLITEMENHSDDLVVIFAGYPDEISKMIALNPGMKSRVPYTLEFPNYTAKELSDIFMKMVNENFSCTEDLQQHVEEFFTNIPDEVMNDKTFGNGRFVRNIYERTWGKAIARGSENGFDSIVLNCHDFDEATEEYQYSDKGHTVRKIGF